LILQAISKISNRVRFDRNELAGAFGDIGTDLPLLIGVLAASGADTASVLVVYGLMQICSGLWYGMPMPVQPLKAFAALVIAKKIQPAIIYGGGLAIGISMFLLSVTGLINWIARIVPKAVVRGIQLGLGFQLATLALKEYVPATGLPGYLLAGLCFVVAIAFTFLPGFSFCQYFLPGQHRCYAAAVSYSHPSRYADGLFPVGAAADTAFFR